MAGPLSLGLPRPSKALPSISSETDILAVSPRKRTDVPVVLSPRVEPKTCTMASPAPESRTCPRTRSPSALVTSTISPYAAFCTFSTKMSGPATWLTVLYESGSGHQAHYLLGE